MAVRTWFADHRARALTGRTGLLYREKTLLHADLTNTTASRTFDRLSAFLGAAAATGLTSNLGRYIDCYGIAANRFFEIETQFIAQIGTTKYLTASLPATAKMSPKTSPKISPNP
jgi:hypothetical protein